MSGQLIIILGLTFLLLPTVGAIIARVVGARLGDTTTQIIGGVGFLLALGSAVVLSSIEVDRLDLRSLAIFVPAPGPVVDSDTFTLSKPTSEPRAGGVLPDEEATQIVAEVVPPLISATEGIVAPTETPAPTVTAEPTPEPTPTLEPTATLEPTPEPTTTLEPTPAPTPEPTATPEPPEPTAVPEPEPPVEPVEEPAPEPTTYTVARGDTLRGIAERFGVSVATLLRANNLTPEEADALPVGRVLTIPAQSDPPAPPQPTTPPRQPAQAYIVEPGDTLRSIAERFDVSVDSLLRYNGLTREQGDSLRIGQKLLIPPR